MSLFARSYDEYRLIIEIENAGRRADQAKQDAERAESSVRDMDNRLTRELSSLSDQLYAMTHEIQSLEAENAALKQRVEELEGK